ncbi:MAG: hypothetical protein ACOYJV_00845 [Aminivibrio sp.]|jgi:hypothetical protein
MEEARVFERNIFGDELLWMGVIDLPQLVDEIIAEDQLTVDSPEDFEVNLDEWWPEFISDLCL